MKLEAYNNDALKSPHRNILTSNFTAYALMVTEKSPETKIAEFRLFRFFPEVLFILNQKSESKEISLFSCPNLVSTRIIQNDRSGHLI